MKPKVLVVYHALTFSGRSAVLDHLGAFRRHADADCTYVNIRSGTIPKWLAQAPFDVIVFDSSFFSDRWTATAFLDTVAKARGLKANPARKVAFPQDEFLQTQLVCDFFNEFGIDVVYSLCPEEDWENVYRWCDRNRIRIRRKLAAYADDRTVQRTGALVKDHAERSIDIGYRAWRALPWLGRHGQLKARIAEAVLKAAPPDLSLDISTENEKMFIGDAWLRFLADCRCVLGVEGGASLLDADGSARFATEAYLKALPEAAFEQVEQACFPGRDATLRLRVITSRHFEAAMTKSCQVLVRGTFNDILQADRDYIPVESDFSNLESVFEQVRNHDLCRARAENAWNTLIGSGQYTYQRFIREVMDDALAGPDSIRSRAWDQTAWAAVEQRALDIERSNWQEMIERWAERLPASEADPQQLEDFLRLAASEIGAPIAKPAAPVEDTIDNPFDSVYFLMWPGWRIETESNRWHYGQRWARSLPLVMIQAELPQHAGWRVEPERRIPNAEILSVVESSWAVEDIFLTGLRQARQIVDHMRYRGYKRPLFWCYSCSMIFPYLTIPAVSRVFHGTENYFDFPGLKDPWLHLQRSAIDASDTVICCSRGVFGGFLTETGRSDMLLVNNGCDYRRYNDAPRPAAWDARFRRIEELAAQGASLVVFAGSLDIRTDWDLLVLLSREFPERTFVFAGLIKRADLSIPDTAMLEVLLLRPNVLHLGVLHPDEVAYLYRFCDLGIIPYRHLDFLVNNGFPLKALEMAAAGLPVVSTLMRPLYDVADAVQVVETLDAFVEAVRTSSKRTRSAEQAAKADAIAHAHDYDALFEGVRQRITRAADGRAPRVGNLDRIRQRFGDEMFTTMIQRLIVQPMPPQDAVVATAASWLTALAARLPQPVVRVMRQPVKRMLRRFI